MGSGATALVTSSIYYPSSGWLKQRINPDGNWTYYEYDATGLITRTVQGLKNAGPEQHSNPSVCRERQYTYTPQDASDNQNKWPLLARRTVEKVQSQMVAVSYLIVNPTQTIEVQAPNLSVAWSDAGNLFVTNVYDAAGVKLRQTHPEGTLTTYQSVTNAPLSLRTNIVATGRPNANWTQVVEGTRQVTTLNWGNYSGRF